MARGTESTSRSLRRAGAIAEPYYVPLGDEVDIFAAAYAKRLPVLLKGPTGCGKTRFVEYMCWYLSAEYPMPLTTVACHEDLTATDLIGRYLLDVDGTRWIDGSLTLAVRNGGICYLDEIMEARKDTTVVIHSLTDYRRMLTIEKLGETVKAHDDFLLVLSYNPGYQSSLKDLKLSTRQRFVAIEFGYPPVDIEADIITHEGEVDHDTAHTLAFLGSQMRNLQGETAIEGPSTRLLIYTAKLIGSGIQPRRAADIAIINVVTDEAVVKEGLQEVVDAVLVQ